MQTTRQSRRHCPRFSTYLRQCLGMCTARPQLTARHVQPSPRLPRMVRQLGIEEGFAHLLSQQLVPLQGGKFSAAAAAAAGSNWHSMHDAEHGNMQACANARHPPIVRRFQIDFLFPDIPPPPPFSLADYEEVSYLVPRGKKWRPGWAGWARHAGAACRHVSSAPAPSFGHLLKGRGYQTCASMSQHLFESLLVHKKCIHMHFRAILHWYGT